MFSRYLIPVLQDFIDHPHLLCFVDMRKPDFDGLAHLGHIKEAAKGVLSDAVANN